MKPATLFKRMITLTTLMLCVSVLTFGPAYGAQNPETLPVVAGKAIPLTAPPIPPDFKFTHLSFEEGLSQTTVVSILQDSRGFMWFGTQDGLNRYDGYNFLVYRNDPNDLTSVGGNFVRTIIEGPSGFLWIGTVEEGLNKYDPGTDTFIRYRHDPDNPNSLKNNTVWSIWQDEAGLLWLYMDDGWLTQFDPLSETFTHYQSTPAEPSILDIARYELKTIYQDKTGAFWLSNHGGGLAGFSRETGRFTYFLHDPDDATTIGAGQVTNIYEDRAGNLWISTTEGGLNLLDRDSGQFTHFQYDPDDPYSISDNSCRQVYQDRTGTYWVATGGGLNLFDPRTGQFIRYQEDPTNPYALSDDNINTIYEDRGGVLWFGTDGGGLNKLDLGTIQFIHYRNLPGNPNSLSTSYIYSIYEDADGILWVGGDDGVLNRFDRANNQVTRYEPDAEDPHALNESWSVSAIYEDSTGAFWVGTFGGGLHAFDRKTEQFQRYLYNPDEPHSIASDIILAIYEDSAGTLWIGTDGGGLNRFDRQTGAFHSYMLDPDDPNNPGPGNVRGIYEDQLGFLWLTGWGEGLTRFDPRTEQFVNYRHDPENPHSLSIDTTYVVHEDQEGALWVGTSGGLNQFDRETETFSHYTEKDGLPNSVIYAIMEDASGNLWVSTNRGVSKFDPRAETFQNYNVFDGLQSDEFNQNAFFQSSSGEMFFGGINGLNAFYPEQITNNPYRLPVILTDLQLFNQSVAIGKDSILQRPIWNTERVTLNYDQDVFSIAFAALSYAAPEENRYRYKLEGFDDEWNEVDAKRRFATYTSLPPGDYIFRVQGANEDGVWNEEGVSLSITITPPWWQTWWFRGVAALLTVGLIAGAFVWQRQSAKRRERILETQVAERTRDLRVAADVSKQITTVLDIDTLLQQVVVLTVQSFDLYTALVFLLQEDNQTLAYVTGADSSGQIYEPGAMPRELSIHTRPSLVTRAARNMEVVCINDVTQSPDYWHRSELPETRSELAIPMSLGDQLLGVFDLQAEQPHRFGEEDTRVLTTLAEQIAIAVRNAQLFTASQAAQQKAETAQSAAEAANQAKSAFLANMSHELRTPLNAILGYAGILKQRTGYTGPLVDGLDIIHRSGDHLLTLINDVLDLAKIEAGKLDLTLAPIHLPTFLEQIVGIIHARAEAKDLTLTYEPLSPLPAMVLADETRLRQVLLNLLSNAVKFTERGHVALTVAALDDAQAGAAQVALRFRVEDTGVGIAPEQLERIFQPFEQAGEADKRAEGTGLGLAISRQIVQRMGGRLQVESPPAELDASSLAALRDANAAPPSVPPAELDASSPAGEGEVKGGPGSAFWFDVTLPLTEMPTREEPIPVRDIVGYEGPRRAVLVADDRQYNRLLLVDMLEPLGFEVRSASDGQQAVEMALELRPDAIVIDNVMPVKTGFEAVQEMRQQPALRDVVIIAASASVLETDREKSRVAGCDAFLPKPVKTEDLLDLLATHLGLSWITAEPKTESEAPLVPLPAEELAALRELARLGRMWDIRVHALRLAEMDAAYIPFSDKLQALTTSFEIDQIVAFVEQFVEAELVPPPREELEVLLDLAQRGDMRAIGERAAHIETLGELYVPFARKLRELANSFEEREILALVRRYVEHK